MGTVYNDARYGVEKVITFPAINFAAAVLNSVRATITLTEAITPIEFGAWVSTTIATSSAIAMDLNITGTALVALGTITIVSATAVGVNGTATLTSTTSISNGDILIIRATTSSTAGAAVPYLKYREKFAL